MNNPVIYTQTNVFQDHIVVKLKVGFMLQKNESFSDGVNKLIETISFGRKGEFDLERKGAREEYQVKVIGFDYDDSSYKNDEVTGSIQIALPIKLCTINQGIPHIFASIMYASVYSFINEYQVTDIQFPDVYLKHLPKPKYGTSIFSDDENKLKIGLILKPRSIINANIASKFIYKAGQAGVDYISDDELTIDPPEWRFKDRIPFIKNLLLELESETGKSIKYIANISGSYDTSMKLAKIAEDNNVDGIMVNTITMGYDVIQNLAKNKRFKPFIVANVIGRNLMAGGTKYLVADYIHSFLARVSGADAVYTGPFVGNVKSRNEKASHFIWALTDSLSKKYPVKTSYAVMSGGLEPKNLLENWRIYQSPVMFSLGHSLCNLINQDISIVLVLKIIKTVFDAEKKGGAEEVERDITQLAASDKNYLQILNILGWK